MSDENDELQYYIITATIVDLFQCNTIMIMEEDEVHKNKKSSVIVCVFVFCFYSRFQQPRSSIFCAVSQAFITNCSPSFGSRACW